MKFMHLSKSSMTLHQWFLTRNLSSASTSKRDKGQFKINFYKINSLILIIKINVTEHHIYFVSLNYLNFKIQEQLLELQFHKTKLIIKKRDQKGLEPLHYLDLTEKKLILAEKIMNQDQLEEKKKRKPPLSCGNPEFFQ